MLLINPSIWSEITGTEIIIYILVISLFLVIIMFYIAGRSKSDMIEKSVCYDETSIARDQAQYSVAANVKTTQAFQVFYNTEDQTTKAVCACPPGDNESVFSSIPYYDIKPGTSDTKRLKYINKLSCSCETPMTSSANDPKITYDGEPGLVNFMYDQNNKIFFDNILHGSNPEYEQPLFTD